MLLQTIDDLIKATAKPNPVNIAGYGRESTHKGYLSWIFNGDRWEGASAAFLAICKESKMSPLPFRIIKKISCEWEWKLAKRRKVDLVVFVETDTGKYAVPIELKTDSGQSGENQFEIMSGGQIDGYEIPLRLIFALGSAAVQDFKDIGKFIKLSNEDLLKAFADWKPEGFFGDWIESLSIEAARKAHGPEVYRRCVSKDNPTLRYNNCGYRTYDHLMYYVLDHVRLKIGDSLGDRFLWTLYSGGYNAVLNFDRRWKLRGLKAWVFFEFNNSTFVMKIQNQDSDKERIRQLLHLVRTNAVEWYPANLTPVPPRSNKLDATWLSVLYWNLNIEDADAVGEMISSVINHTIREGPLTDQLESLQPMRF